MKISDQISLAAKNLTRRPGRTALTVVGVVVGTCAVIVMISLGVAQSKSQEEMLAQWSDLTQIQVYGGGHKDGKELKALELPGLWNGAMSDWSTVFVEVPLSTFNPVKTVNDLYREQHQ